MQRFLVGVLGVVAVLAAMPATAAPMIPPRPAFHVTAAAPAPLVRHVQYYAPQRGSSYPHRLHRAERRHHVARRHDHPRHHTYAHLR